MGRAGAFHERHGRPRALGVGPVSRACGSEVPAVVVVDDEASIRKLYSTALELAGFRVAGAATGKEALARVREMDAAVVVLDANLPDMAGEEVLDRLRAAPETEHVSVLIVTGDDTRERRVAGLGRGANDYLIKPVDPCELVVRVQGQLRVRDRWLDRMDETMSLRRQLASELAGLDAGAALVDLAKAVAGILRTPLEVTDLWLTPLFGRQFGCPVGAGGAPSAGRAGGAARAEAGPVIERLNGGAQVHVALESVGGVYAVLSLATSAAPDRVLSAVLRPARPAEHAGVPGGERRHGPGPHPRRDRRHGARRVDHAGVPADRGAADRSYRGL